MPATPNAAEAASTAEDVRQLTARELEILGKAWKCFKTQPEVRSYLSFVANFLFLPSSTVSPSP